MGSGYHFSMNAKPETTARPYSAANVAYHLTMLRLEHANRRLQALRARMAAK